MTVAARPKPRAPMKKPAAAVAPVPYAAQVRTDGIHMVDTRTGQSWGIAATPEIAANQIAAANRLSA